MIYYDTRQKPYTTTSDHLLTHYTLTIRSTHDTLSVFTSQLLAGQIEGKITLTHPSQPPWRRGRLRGGEKFFNSKISLNNLVIIIILVLSIL